MLKELTVKEVETILSKDNNVYGIDNIWWSCVQNTRFRVYRT